MITIIKTVSSNIDLLTTISPSLLAELQAEISKGNSIMLVKVKKEDLVKAQTLIKQTNGMD